MASDPNLEEICSNLEVGMAELSSKHSKCLIYKVHRHLRNQNPTAYEPNMIAIGPYHRDKEHLKAMERHKLRYLDILLREKTPLCNVRMYASAVATIEAEARACYTDLTETLTRSQFIQMLLLDGCFIIQLIRTFESHISQDIDPILKMDWMINSLQRDLMLFENQVPFFVLYKLYNIIDPQDNYSELYTLLISFFSSLFPEKGYRMPNISPHQVKHLLDFIHRSWLPPPNCSDEDSSTIRMAITHDVHNNLRFINSATRLDDANIKFDARCKGASLFDVVFEGGVMMMAPLTIEDRTESLLRNLVVFEQYFERQHSYHPSYVTDYVMLLDNIIDSSKDVEILSRAGIIHNYLGSEEKVVEMMNKMGSSIAHTGRNLIYAEMFEKVRKHCGKRHNRWSANLAGNYFNSPWSIISFNVAFVVLICTVVQTVCSILSLVKGD